MLKRELRARVIETKLSICLFIRERRKRKISFLNEKFFLYLNISSRKHCGKKRFHKFSHIAYLHVYILKFTAISRKK